MALFDGVQNFNPAFQGRQLAIQSGQGAGQSIARGAAMRQRQQQVDFLTDTSALDEWAKRRQRALLPPSQSWSPAVPWDQMPIHGPKGM